MYWPAERLTNELSFPDGSNQTSLGKSVSLLTKEFYCVRGTHQVGLKLTRQRQKSHFCVSDGARDVNRKKTGFKSTTQQQLGDGGSVSVKTDFAPKPARSEIQEGEQKKTRGKTKKSLAGRDSNARIGRLFDVENRGSVFWWAPEIVILTKALVRVGTRRRSKPRKRREWPPTRTT